MNSTKRILIAPLNWGLGHATRCMPVIDLLRETGNTFVIASDGDALSLLIKEYPDAEFIELPTYNISYGRKGSIFSIAKNIPGIHRAIAAEKKILQDHLLHHSYDLIISDNRYGIYSEEIYSVMITHQLQPQLPNSWKVMSRSVHSVIARYLNNFSEVWIPDDPTINISGILSAGNYKTSIKYIGLLSRLKNIPVDDTRYDIVTILSGPEPQRSILENELESQLKKLDLKSIIIAGKPDGKRYQPDSEKKFQKISYLTAIELNKIILQSEVIISRSGYSSIMDLLKLNKKGILIPTPGQTEQEYLAKRWAADPQFFIQEQGSINIEDSYNKIITEKISSKEIQENHLLKNVLENALTINSSMHPYHPE